MMQSKKNALQHVEGVDLTTTAFRMQFVATLICVRNRREFIGCYWNNYNIRSVREDTKNFQLH